MKRISNLLILFLLPACVFAQQLDSDEMLQKASALTKLSKAVESTVRYKHPPEGISSDKLIELSTQHDLSLVTEFDDDVVKVLWHDRHSIVLICDQDGRGLLEDAGCTAELDQHLWKIDNAPCEFTLEIESVCSE